MKAASLPVGKLPVPSAITKPGNGMPFRTDRAEVDPSPAEDQSCSAQRMETPPRWQDQSRPVRETQGAASTDQAQTRRAKMVLAVQRSQVNRKESDGTPHDLGVERKRFLFKVGGNIRGQYLRITEEISGRYNSIVVPLCGVAEFVAAVGAVVQEAGLESDGARSSVSAERKRYLFKVGQNMRGQYLRVIEEVSGRYNSIVVPLSRVEEFVAAVETVVQEAKPLVGVIRDDRNE